MGHYTNLYPRAEYCADPAQLQGHGIMRHTAADTSKTHPAPREPRDDEISTNT